MEDSVGEEERREQGKPMAQAVKKDEQVVASGGSEPGDEGGFLSAMASKIGAAMAGGNESSGEDGGKGNVSSGEQDEEKKEDDGRGGGGGGIFQKLMSSSHAPSPDSGASSSETGEVRAQDTGGEQGGILSSMASRIGMSRSGASGNGDHSAGGDAKTSNGGDAVDHRKSEEENGADANGGGILSTMATKIGMAMSSANGNGDHRTADDAKMSNGDAAVERVKGEEQVKGEEAGDGGILSAVASKIGMAMSGADADGNHGGSGDGARTSNGDPEGGGSKVDEKGSEANGGGLVDQIISNLPSEDQAPEADEASLLIAIIED